MLDKTETDYHKITIYETEKAGHIIRPGKTRVVPASLNTPITLPEKCKIFTITFAFQIAEIQSCTRLTILFDCCEFPYPFYVLQVASSRQKQKKPR